MLALAITKQIIQAKLLTLPMPATAMIHWANVVCRTVRDFQCPINKVCLKENEIAGIHGIMVQVIVHHCSWFFNSNSGNNNFQSILSWFHRKTTS